MGVGVGVGVALFLGFGVAQPPTPFRVQSFARTYSFRVQGLARHSFQGSTFRIHPLLFGVWVFSHTHSFQGISRVS